ncbi:MAG: hypothetical protein FWC80_07385 [Firmicutes bacterium]|nr:hypothetical protein [Bacillota bacterium]
MSKKDITKDKLKKNPHAGRRQRMFDKHFENPEMTALQPHEILEMLLYHGTPLKDTNVLAHNLIDTFGSLGNVLLATPDELTNFAGLTQRAASLISMIMPLARRAEIEYNHKEPVYLSRFADAVIYLRPYFSCRKDEMILIVSLDINEQVIAADWLSRGMPNFAVLDTRDAVGAVCRRRATKSILVHNHPAGSNKPSNNDDILTKNMFSALKGVGVELLDHIILTATEEYSYRKSGRLFDLVSSAYEGLGDTGIAERRAYRTPEGGLIDDDDY